MTGQAPGDVFVDLLAATLGGTRNYHRLEHLGRRGDYTFNEETVTDLLLAEMAGKAYVVGAECPACAPGAACRHWDGGPAATKGGARVRALTKIEEGGNSRTGRQGAHADFVLAVEDTDPNDPAAATSAPQLRLLVQAKRARPGTTFLNDKVVRAQYDGLLAAATRFGALPYYVLYVQQPDPHTSTPTRCGRHVTAADRAIVLVPAGPHATPKGHLPGVTVEEALAAGRPLRCLAGCACTGSSSDASAWQAVGAFVRSDFPGYDGTSSVTELPAAVPRLIVNSARYRPRVAPRPRGVSPAAGSTDQDLLVVRLGALAQAPEPQRRYVGYAPGMSADDLRDAARMAWRLDQRRARGLRYVVAASGREALQAYEILPDSLTYTRSAAGTRRAAFGLIEVAEPTVSRRLLKRAEGALANVPWGAQNPVLYVG